jgi:MT0933-like antitoxin protein
MRRRPLHRTATVTPLGGYRGEVSLTGVALRANGVIRIVSGQFVEEPFLGVPVRRRPDVKKVTDMGFEEMKNQVKDKLGQNSDKVEEGVDKARDFVDEKTGGKHTEQLDKAADAAKNTFGGGQQ